MVVKRRVMTATGAGRTNKTMIAGKQTPTNEDTTESTGE